MPFPVSWNGAVTVRTRVDPTGVTPRESRVKRRQCPHARSVSASRQPVSAYSRPKRSHEPPTSPLIAADVSRRTKRTRASPVSARNTCSKLTVNGRSMARREKTWRATLITPATRMRRQFCATARLCSSRSAELRWEKKLRTTTARTTSICSLKILAAAVRSAAPRRPLAAGDRQSLSADRRTFVAKLGDETHRFTAGESLTWDRRR